MTRFSVRELGPGTWPDFVRIVEKHNGVWGGCWCVTFHHPTGKKNRNCGGEQGAQEEAGHGRPDPQRPGVRRRPGRGLVPVRTPCRDTGADERLREAGPRPARQEDTCFFVDRVGRKDGVAKAAPAGALRIIASEGVGTVDGYPISTHGKPYGSSFLWRGTESMFEEAGFHRINRLGTSKVVMQRTVHGR